MSKHFWLHQPNNLKPAMLPTPTIETDLRGDCFDTDNLTNLRFSRIDNSVDFSWGTGSPSSAIASDSFLGR